MTTTKIPPSAPETTRVLDTASRRPWVILVAVVVLAALVALVVALMAGGDSEATAEDEAAALQELVAKQKAVLDPYVANSDPAPYVAMYADEVTYIDPNSGGVLANQAARDFLMSYAGLIPPFTYEIVEPKVDLLGDTAVFTFICELFLEGEPAVTYTTTEIHERAGDGWELVHAHWSVPAPPPEG